MQAAAAQQGRIIGARGARPQLPLLLAAGRWEVVGAGTVAEPVVLPLHPLCELPSHPARVSSTPVHVGTGGLAMLLQLQMLALVQVAVGMPMVGMSAVMQATLLPRGDPQRPPL